MNTRLLAPIVAFIIWSIICWRWYVCDIKQHCNGAKKPSLSGQAVPYAVDELVRENAETSPPAVAPLPQPPTPTQTEEPADLGQVSFSQQPDLVLIHFPYNSTRQQDADAADAYLSQLAAYLNATHQKVIITGHTDNVGDTKSNLQLGLKRAEGIKKILISKGVPPEHISCKSKGEKEPIATNDNPRGRYKNRRVEIRIIP